MTTASAPHVDVTVGLGDDATVNDAAKGLARQLLPDWHAVTSNDAIEVAVISGGTTNRLLCLHPPAASGLEPVIMRLFGDLPEMIINRTDELAALLRLNDAGFGAKVVATFGNGRIEEYLHLSTLEPHHLLEPRISGAVARRMRRFHTIDMLGAKEPQFLPILQRWIAEAKTLTSDDPAKQAVLDAADFDEWEAEFRDLSRGIAALNSPTVFSHNDLLAGNIMVPHHVVGAQLPSDEAPRALVHGGGAESDRFTENGGSAAGSDIASTASGAGQGSGRSSSLDPRAGSGAGSSRRIKSLGSLGSLGSPGEGSAGSSPAASLSDDFTVQFIDFEYSFYSYRGFDWGNHFNEFAGFECDYSKYPSREDRAHFVAEYLTEELGRSPTEAEVDAAVVEANVFALASHMFWGVWAILQVKYSAVDFDYASYGQHRWAEYHRRKDEFLAPLMAGAGKKAQANERVLETVGS